MARDDLLFCKIDAFSVQANQRAQIEADVAAMDGNKLLNSNSDDVVDFVVEKYRVDVPELDETKMTVDQKESGRDISGDPFRMGYGRGPRKVTGTEVTVDIPFTGDPAMFGVSPSSRDSAPPRGEVVGNTLRFHYWSDRPEADKLRSALDTWLTSINRYLTWQTDSFKGFNEALATAATTAVARRRDKLLANQNLVAALGIPLKRRHGESTTFPAPEVRRKIAPKAPPATAGSFKAEPTLDEAEYQHILDVIDGMVKVIERSPTAFHDISEEALRTHFLVQLNGQYEGQATGETFNYEGKTDILIRSGDRNIFIAECKFWSGPAGLVEAINQLLGYLTWRDSKTAILVFNRNKDLSKVLSAVPDVVRGHPNFQKEEGKRGETGFRFAFRNRDDNAKILHITVMVFDVPRQVE
jgi:hypothetical protein